MSLRTWSVVAVAVGLLGGGCGSQQEQAPLPEPLLVPWSQLSGRIAYLRGDHEVMLIDSNRQEVRLVHAADADHMLRDVTWNADGTSLTVTEFTLPRNNASGWSLASIDARTGAKTDLYPGLPAASFAAWSRDGRIAFAGRDQAGPGLFIDGVPASRVVVPAPLGAPSWSPGGGTLALAVEGSSYHGYGDLVLLDVAIGTAVALGPTLCAEPSHSRDGARIAYVHIEPTSGLDQLWLVSVPGGAMTHLSAADAILPAHPTWSGDGARIAVHAQTDLGNPQLHLVDAVNGTTVQLTANGGHHPAWFP